MHISLTRLKLHSPLLLGGFVKGANASIAQIQRARGFQGGALLVDSWFTFWTISGWESEAAMRAFRDAGAHGAIMPKLLDWCCEASVASWEAEALPDWPQAHAQMLALGRSSKVKRPNRNHLAGKIAPIRPWFPERPIPAKA